MSSRESSLANFCSTIDNLCLTKYIMANAKIFEVISQIKQSKLLNDMFNHFVKDYDFYNGLVNALSEVDGVKSFVMPVKSTEVMAFTYCLLTEISQKKLQLTDLLDYFDNSKNYEKAYLKFCQDVLQPFKTYVYQSAMQVINMTQITSEPVIVSEVVEEEKPTKIEDIDVKKASLPVTIIRLLELDGLSVRSSRLSKDEKEDLLYVLELFTEIIRGKDVEKIKLCYLAYYYAFKPYKKIKTNIEDLTEILKNEGII